MAVTPANLGTYLGVDVDVDRAQYLIEQAENLCLSLVDPLPPGADAVILDVVARAFTNPGNVQAQNVGPFSATYGAASGGLWLTRQNKATLRRAAGTGGAFAIDMAPVDAESRLPWWDVNTPIYTDISVERP